MRIGTMSLSIGDPSAGLDGLVDEAKRLEAWGFDFFAVPQMFGLDALTALAIVGRETERIELATGVVPTPPRHPSALAQQALTTQMASGGRLTLGIGLSHKLVIEHLLGLSYARPAQQMREYLEVLMPLVNGKPADVRGEIYQVTMGLSLEDVPPVPVIVAALGPQMLRVAGSLADGTVTWMTGLKTLEQHTVPTIREAASEAGRAEPRVIAALPIALTRDVEAGRAQVDESYAMYGGLPSYRAMLDREGVAGPGGVGIVGDEAELRATLGRLSEIGVTDFAAGLVETEPGAIERTLEFLRSEHGH